MMQENNYQNEFIPIARMIDGHNIKYEHLLSITNAQFANSNINVVDLFIDLNYITKRIYKNMKLDVKDSLSVASALINLASHYRHFFLSRYDVYTNVYFINSMNTHEYNRQFVRGYNDGYINLLYNLKSSNMRTLLEDNMDVVRMICKFLPNVFFVDSAYDTGVVIYDIISKYDVSNQHAHIILSGDQYLYQLVAMNTPNTVILRKRTTGAEYINANNLFEVFAKERDIKTDLTSLSPGLYSAVLALSSVPSRSIPAVLTLPRAAKVLLKMISEHRIQNSYNNDIQYMWNSIILNGGISSATSQSLSDRYKAIDIAFMHKIFMTDASADYKDAIVNLNDPNSVRHINDMYFKNNPLDLNRL